MDQMAKNGRKGPNWTKWDQNNIFFLKKKDCLDLGHCILLFTEFFQNSSSFWLP